jgi:hypothetical protein
MAANQPAQQAASQPTAIVSIEISGLHLAQRMYDKSTTLKK